jgi:outer membrane receptor protein involved in Fe transport
VLHILNNGNPAQVYLFASPSVSEQGLGTTGLYVQDGWRLNSRLTLNLGIRYDRYRNFLPPQEGPPPGRFNTTQVSFPENSNVNTYNNVVPRLGMVFDLTGQGRTVLKANYGLYAWNPGTALSEGVNNNPADWYRQYAWADPNGNRVYDRGEEGVVIAQRGGAGSAFLDPNIKNTMTSEVSAWLEHELMPGFAIAGGYVYRGIDNFRVLVNENRPMSAYDVPTAIRDPGPDGVLGNADDGPNIAGFNLNAAALAAGVRNLTTNLPGSAEYHTVEFSATKRQAGRWSLQGSFAQRWNKDQETAYFGNNLRSLTTPSTPNDLINTAGGRYEFSMWNIKINGSIDVGWDVRLTPALRIQQGQPFGRTFLAGAANGINYGNQRMLVEPVGTQRQDTISILDLRAEKSIRMGGQRLGLFADMYNIANADAAQNIGWNVGASYLRPVTIIGPRIMRFGAKFDW